jgi:alkylated DNA repair dioxygenase AlkB
MTTIIETKHSKSVYYESFYNEERANHLFAKCLDLDLDHHPVARMGVMRRSIGFFSNEGEGYKYTGQITKSQPIPPFLQKVLDRVNRKMKTKFNGILVNKYEDGSEKIGAHSDNEKELSGDKVVGISLGAARKIRFRGISRAGKKAIKGNFIDHLLEHGSLYTMEDMFQKEFTHEIPPDVKVKNTRFSLTFRKHD